MDITPWERLGYVMRKDYMDEILEQSQTRVEGRRNGIDDGEGEDGAKLLQGTDVLVMTFEGCMFQNNSQGESELGSPTYGVVWKRCHHQGLHFRMERVQRRKWSIWRSIDCLFGVLLNT